MLGHVLAFAVLFVQFTYSQAQNCSVNGEVQGVLTDALPADSYNDCLQACQVDIGSCECFTYFR